MVVFQQEFRVFFETSFVGSSDGMAPSSSHFCSAHGGHFRREGKGEFRRLRCPAGFTLAELKSLSRNLAFDVPRAVARLQGTLAPIVGGGMLPGRICGGYEPQAVFDKNHSRDPRDSLNMKILKEFKIWPSDCRGLRDWEGCP